MSTLTLTEKKWKSGLALKKVPWFCPFMDYISQLKYSFKSVSEKKNQTFFSARLFLLCVVDEMIIQIV